MLVGPQLWLGGLSRRMLVLAPMTDCERASRARVVIDPRHTISGTSCRDGFYLAASGDEVEHDGRHGDGSASVPGEHRGQ